MNLSNIDHRNYVFALLLAVTHELLFSKHIAASDNTPLIIDMKIGTIDEISISATPNEFKNMLGEKNVTPFQFMAEEEELTAYRLKFKNGETASLYEAFVEIDSPGFVTKSGLGVGSTWEQFREAFPDAEMNWYEDVGGIWSEEYKFRLYFNQRGKPQNKSLVTRIHMNRPAGHW